MLTIDASVLVASDVEDEVAHGVSSAFLRRVITSRVAIHEPTLAVVEVTSAIARRTGRPALGREVGLQAMKLPGMTFHDLDVRTAVLAAGIASDLGLRSGDAVYAATALVNGATLVTLDKQLAARASAVVSTMTPAEWLGIEP